MISLPSKISRIPRLVRGSLALFAIAVGTALLPAPAWCFDVVAVKNADLKPYADLLRGVKDACGCRVTELLLRDEEASEKVLAGGSPDAVVAVGTTVFKKVKAIRHLPIVYTMVMPSEVSRSTQSNISGVNMDLSPSTYLKAIKQVFPGAKRIGLIYDPRQTGPFVEEAVRAARSADLALSTRSLADASRVPAALEEMSGKIDLFWMIPDISAVAGHSVEYLLHFSVQHSIPVFSFSRKYVEMGAVAALEIDPYDMGVQAGEILRKIASGPVQSQRVYARNSHLIINKKVAEKMGVPIKDDAARRNHSFGQ